MTTSATIPKVGNKREVIISLFQRCPGQFEIHYAAMSHGNFPLNDSHRPHAVHDQRVNNYYQKRKKNTVELSASVKIMINICLANGALGCGGHASSGLSVTRYEQRSVLAMNLFVTD